MLQKTIVYVSRVTNLSDARYCAGMGVDWLGYVVDPSHTDYVSPVQYQSMVGWISGPGRVVEITAEGLDLPAILADYAPDVIHLSLELINQYNLPDLPLIIQAGMDDWPGTMSRIQSLDRKVLYVVLSGAMKETELSGLQLDGSVKVLLSLESDLGPLARLVQKTKAGGFALRGSKEIAPGLKDYDHLAQVLEELQG